MIKVIFYIVKAAMAAITALLFVSCGMDKVDGSGNVVTKNRPAQQEFTTIDASNSFEVIIEQGTVRSIVVEADDNFHEHIKTEIKGGELSISSDSGFRSGTARVLITLPKLERVEASGSALVKSKGAIKATSIEFVSGKGANIEVTVNAEDVTLESDSGGHITINGKAEHLQAEAASGGHIDAKGLAAKDVDAEASGGGHAYVNPIESLSADASSGGNIFYSNTPNELDKKTSTGGNVAQE